MWGEIAGAVIQLAGGLAQDDNGAEGLMDAQADLARTQGAAAKEYLDLWRSDYKPVEQQLVKDAKDYGGFADQERLAGEATSQVASSFSDARKSLDRTLAPWSVSPNQGGKLATAYSELEASGAAQGAAAANAARTGAREAGFQRRYGIAQLGRGLQSSATNSAGQAMSGFTNALNGANQMTANQSYALAPFVTAASKGVEGYVNNNWSNWFGGGNTTAPAVPSASKAKIGHNKGGRIGIRRYADGGEVYEGEFTTHKGAVEGPGDGTVDTVPALLANEEHVVNAEGVEVLGRDFLDAVNMIGIMKRYQNEQRAGA